jgi:hypothetical protein
MEDYRPICYWCGKKLNNKGRMHLKKTGEPLCYRCFEWFKITLDKHGFKTDKGEAYP